MDWKERGKQLVTRRQEADREYLRSVAEKRRKKEEESAFEDCTRNHIRGLLPTAVNAAKSVAEQIGATVECRTTRDEESGMPVLFFWTYAYITIHPIGIVIRFRRFNRGVGPSFIDICTAGLGYAEANCPGEIIASGDKKALHHWIVEALQGILWKKG